jgi:6-phosphogluconolactonase
MNAIIGANYSRQIFKDVESLYETIAYRIIDLANKSVATKGKFSIALSGGKTPGRLYELLATNDFIEKMPWKDTFVFWSDERCVSLNSNDNNAYNAKNILLNKVPLPPENIHRIPVNLPPAEAAKAYEKTIISFFREDEVTFDLILLGLGENGHTASIFPETEVVNTNKAGVMEVYLTKEKMFRVTMTAPLINRADNVFFIVIGDEKSIVLKDVLEGEYQPDKLPAQLINPFSGNLFWFIDGDAASELA